jgi:hypothetical protein
VHELVLNKVNAGNVYIKGTRRTLVASSKVYATIQSVYCGHSVMNGMQNNRHASISNSITIVQSLRAQWTRSCQDIWSRSLFLFNDTFSNSYCAHSHYRLVHGEPWKTWDTSLHSRTKVLSMYKTRCSDSSYWTSELYRTCHCVLTQVLYILLTQCLNLRGKAVKEDCFLNCLTLKVTQNISLHHQQLFNH